MKKLNKKSMFVMAVNERPPPLLNEQAERRYPHGRRYDGEPEEEGSNEQLEWSRSHHTADAEEAVREGG